jgi:holo-[acyl-carrier protein] synthase
MSLIGLGIDLVEVKRVRDLLTRHGDRFKDRTFTESEIRYCDSCADPAIHYSARFAAKEAGAKALGTGFSEGVNWKDIEVTRAENGAPSLLFHAGAQALAQKMGVTQALISLTHTADTASAQVILAR